MSGFRFSEHPMVGVDGRDLRLQVWRPTGHPGPLPTLLMLDGQWLRGLIEHELPSLAGKPVLVASLGFNSPERPIIRPWRARDYTPRGPAGKQHDPRHPAWPCGGADNLLDVLEHAVLPFLRRQFDSDLSRTALYGHSYAGLFSIYAWLQHTGLFDRVYAASPSLWWHWPHMLALAQASPALQAVSSLPPLAISVGADERLYSTPAIPGQPRTGGVATARFDADFLAALQAVGIQAARLQIVPGQTHGGMLRWSSGHCLQDWSSRLESTS